MKLQQLLSYTRKAVDDYGMILPGDKIAVVCPETSTAILSESF